jgi:hypothetical protein
MVKDRVFGGFEKENTEKEEEEGGCYLLYVFIPWRERMYMYLSEWKLSSNKSYRGTFSIFWENVSNA